MTRTLAREVAALQLARLRLGRAAVVLEGLAKRGPTSGRRPRPGPTPVRRPNPRHH